MVQYRIKTEQEFIQEFGSEWRCEIDWAESMNYLFGKQVDTNEHQLIDCWDIYPEMITSLPLPTAEPKFGEWVDVKDRLPTVESDNWYVNVLISYEYDGIKEVCEGVFFVNDGVTSFDIADNAFSISSNSVTHWMPLPAPPTNNKG